MARISPLQHSAVQPSVAVAFDRHMQEYQDQITNTKGTLGHSLPAFYAYMQWYPLYEEVERILGKRLASLFAFSISITSHCELCAAFFRKRIVDGGERPDSLSLTPAQRDVVDLGSGIARCQGHIKDHLYERVASVYSEAEMVLLVAFAGQMIAATVFNNVIETDVDEYLQAYVPAMH